MNKEESWLLREKYNGIPSDLYLADLDRLHKGEPLDYIIGFSMFLGCKIDLSLRPLIPRAETEYWTEKAIIKIKEQFGNKKLHILDIFSGSGCIGLGVLSKLTEAHVDFVDNELQAIEQIKRNIQFQDIHPDRYAIYKSNIYRDIPQENRYDVIFANPPYLDIDNIPLIDTSVSNYEPHSALFSEENGMKLIKATILEGRRFLVPGGFLFLECDDNQYEAVSDILQKNGLQYEFFKDQFGLWRFIRAVKPKN